MFIFFSPKEEESQSRYFISLWNVAQGSRPHHILSSTSRITSACFPFEPTSLVFAGCEDGQVLAWDLRLTLLEITHFLQSPAHSKNENLYFLATAQTKPMQPILVSCKAPFRSNLQKPIGPVWGHGPHWSSEVHGYIFDNC